MPVWFLVLLPSAPHTSAAPLPMVVVPYPHASAHQVANARALAEAGAARIVADEDFDADALVDAAALLAQPDAMARMRAAAHSLGRPGAAAAVALSRWTSSMRSRSATAWG